MSSSSPPAAAALKHVQASVIDGRAETARYRQDQLRSLHEALRAEAAPLCAALAQDSGSTAAEVEAEYFLAMDAVRHFYDSVDVQTALAEEYHVVEGKDNPGRRVAAGLVLVRPASHTRFFSIVSPLAAAVAAGNCVVVELQDTLLRLDSVLRALLTKALDPASFALVQEPLTDPEVLAAAVLVDQTAASAPAVSATNQLLSATSARAVAVVDRTADVDAAARHIATARFAFAGHSPYAPDLVLVNEFVKRDFFEACTRYTTLAFAREGPAVAGAGAKLTGNTEEEVRTAVREAEKKMQVSSFGSAEFKLVDILDPNTPLMRMKVSGRYLPVATCSSLVDAIFTHQFEQPLLAGYFFGTPEAGKYLSQFLPSHLALINHIPAHLLVGPAAPLAHAPALPYRYDGAMFSLARPQFVAPPAPAGPLGQVQALLLLGGDGAADAGAKLRARATAPLKPTRQPDNARLDFFASGVLTSLAITLSALLPLLGYTTWVVGRKGLEMAMRKIKE